MQKQISHNCEDKLLTRDLQEGLDSSWGQQLATGSGEWLNVSQLGVLAWGRAKGKTEACVCGRCMCVCVCAPWGQVLSLPRATDACSGWEDGEGENLSPLFATLSIPSNNFRRQGLGGGKRRWQLCKRLGSSLPRAWATLSAGDSSFPWAGVTPAGAISSSGCAVVFGIKKPARQKYKKRKEKKNKKTRKTLEGGKRGTSEERCRESEEKRSEGGELWGRN